MRDRLGIHHKQAFQLSKHVFKASTSKRKNTLQLEVCKKEHRHFHALESKGKMHQA